VILKPWEMPSRSFDRYRNPDQCLIRSHAAPQHTVDGLANLVAKSLVAAEVDGALFCAGLLRGSTLPI